MTSRFHPCRLPRSEHLLSYLVWIVHSLAAFYLAYTVSHSHIGAWVKHWLQPSDYVKGMRIDLSDAEWQVYRKGITHLILDHALHSIGFYLVTKFFRGDVARWAVIAEGAATQIHMTSPTCFLVFLSFTALMTLLVCVSRSRLLSWILCIAFVVRAAEYVPFSRGEHAFYREFNVYLYGAIKTLNFCLHLCKEKNTSYRSLFVDHLLYVAYLPYSMSLIVLFEDFRVQIHKRLSEVPNLPTRSTLFFGVRLFFWFVVYETILHFIFTNSLFNSPFTVISGLDNYQLAAISYVNGQLFHVKYVIIFGLPSFFAYLDGMLPPPPPICISRVARYSRMWRHFDHGLYQFLKHQVYLPLMMPQLPPLLSVLRSLGTLVAVFSVVIAWHGARWHYICWVSLSALELVIEKTGQWIWSSDEFQRLRARIGEVNTRRLVAVGMLATVVPGIFGVFFFLGQEGTGAVVFDRILLSGTKDILTFNLSIDRFNSGFVLLHLLTLGYFFNHVCMSLEKPKAKTN